MPAFILQLQSLLAALGAKLLRTGVATDESWMIAPSWLIRRVGALMKIAREGLFQEALARARVLQAQAKVTPFRHVRMRTIRLRTNATERAPSIRLPRMAQRPFMKPTPRIREPRGVRLLRLRRRIGALMTIAYESPSAHRRRIDRLARGLIAQLSKTQRAGRSQHPARQIVRSSLQTDRRRRVDDG